MQRTMFGSFQTQAVCTPCGGEGKIAKEKCTTCHGDGRVLETEEVTVTIPAGVVSGQTIRMGGQGNAGTQGGRSGDLFITVAVESDPRFIRDGDTLYTTTNISFAQAALGDKIEVETVDGKVKLKIPEGTQTGKKFKLAGKGVPRLQRSGRGDHIVEVVVQTPTNLTRKQKKLLKELTEP